MNSGNVARDIWTSGCKEKPSLLNALGKSGHLMLWIGDYFFEDAKIEGWFDAILIQVRNHPRAIRTVGFADRCDAVSSSKLPEPYPRFADWRSKADLYLESPG